MKTRNIILLTILIISLAIFFHKNIQAKGKDGRILFTSQGYLWAINPDGTDEEKLCDISDYKELTLSPSKKKLAGVKDNDIFVMNTDGSSATNISRSPEIETIHSFSPDGEKIICALKSNPKESKGYIGILKVSGTGYTQLNQFFITKDQDISWSPDKEKITFIIDKNLYIVPSGGEWLKSLASEKIKSLSPFNPSWSPDGKRISFRANISGIGDLCIINVENELFRSIYPAECHNTKSQLHAAEWSYGGDALVFEAASPSSTENNIYMVFADGKPLKLLGKGFKPQWSADGRTVFCQSEEGKMRVMETGINSYNPDRKIYPPYWSLDLLKIVYTNTVTKEAWILDLEKKENTFVTGGDVNVLGWIEN